MIEYRVFGVEELPRVLEIYQNAGWTAYLADSGGLARAVQSSLYLFGAFDGSTLAGFVRCVGDGEHVVYVQDLVVDVPYKRQGIGRALLQAAMEKYACVRMFALVTDAADPVSNAFYRTAGLRPLADAGCVSYMR